MKIAWVRVQGERDSWWQNVKRLLSGQAIRRVTPEAEALRQVKDDLAKAMQARSVPTAEIGLALSHEGYGQRRVVTVLAYDRRWEAEEEPVEVIPGEVPASKLMRGEALRRVTQDTGLTR